MTDAYLSLILIGLYFSSGGDATVKFFPRKEKSLNHALRNFASLLDSF